MTDGRRKGFLCPFFGSRMKRKWGCILCALGYALALLSLLLGVLLDVGTDWELYYALQMQAEILPEAGISEETLLRLDKVLADCLQNGELQPVQAEVFGQNQAAFNERETAHMDDCARLFALARRVAGLSGVAAILLLLSGGLLCKRFARALKGLWGGFAVLLLPVAALGLWAAIDFYAAFNFFHEMLFTNDLWLLNPRTDLLIRICPSSMFAQMGLRIALRFLLLGLGAPALLSVCHALCRNRLRKRKCYETDL